jgi:hypothetical protein
MIESARGGILFIDEAYALSRGEDDHKDFGKEVIEILLKEMSDGPGDIAIIGAGYPKQIRSFIDSNPGLKSRFTEYFHFEDYLPEELFEIAKYASRQKEVVLIEEAAIYLREQLTEAYRKRDEYFGNARFVYAVIEEAKQNMGLRLMKKEDFESISNEELSTLTLADLQLVFQTENMHLFIESNPGFKSRFDKTFEFPDYSATELWDIMLNLLRKEGLMADEEAEKHLRNYLHVLYQNRDKFFGNARSVRQLVGEVVRKQNLRLASIPSDERKKSDLGILNYEDVRHLEITQEGRNSLGFRFGN